MMNLYQLTTFVTVISEGSMTAAADKLYLTQPAVSQQIRNLEEELGVELLARGVRQIKPTAQGEILFEHAKKILHFVQNAETAIKTIGAELKGQLSVGTLSSLGLHLMSPSLGRIMRNNPELKIRLEYDKAEDLIRKFREGELDILIMPKLDQEFEEAVEENVESRMLLHEEMWLVGSGKDMGAGGKIKLSELKKHPFIMMVQEYPTFENQLKIKMRQQSSDVNTIFESSNVGTLKRLIETGLGWGFLPSHSVKKQVRSGRLAKVTIADFEYRVDIMFYARKDHKKTKLIETFFQVIGQDKS
ncbi:MAG: LysR family transcriptional regulator [Bdellovibrionota bacterium]